MAKHSGNDAKKFAIGAGVAALAGFLAGILTAPKSGKETRQDIKDTAQRSVTQAEKELKKLHTELSELLEDLVGKKDDLRGKAAQEVQDVVDKAKVSKEKARELLSALHEGDAEDKDLKQAIADANQAIDHIKDYLKK
jgi:gas vesicle protein